jgi:hypothetical protein
MNTEYYLREIKPFLANITSNYWISKNNYIAVDDLSDKETEEFAMHLFNFYRGEIDFIYDTDYVKEISYLMIDDTTLTKIDFANYFKKSLINYYRKNMQEILDEYIECNISHLCSPDPDYYHRFSLMEGNL